MAFDVTISGTGTDEIITLKDHSNGSFVEIYSFGALLNKFSVINNGTSKNIINGFISPADAIENITKGFKSAKLNPFVCRMKEGSYSFEKKSYKINKFYMGTEAIHGLLYDAVYKIIATEANEDGSFVILQYEYNNQEEGFPFQYSVNVTYRLEKDNRLILHTEVTNTSGVNMPLSDGWHPYFTLGDSVNDLDIKFNSTKKVRFDEQLLPTGEVEKFSEYINFKKLGDTFLDNCFVLENSDGPACVIKDEKSTLQLSILPNTAYPYLQIYTPPDRKSIAIENLSSVPDSFNNGIGLIVLLPGESRSFTTAYQVQKYLIGL